MQRQWKHVAIAGWRLPGFMRVLPVAFALALLFGGVAYAINTIGEGYHLSTTAQSVSGYGSCYSAKTTSGADVFFPTNTQAEWNDFVAYHPGNVSLGSCGWSWVDRSAAGARLWIAFASSADGTHLAAAVYYSYGNGYIWTSTDSGATWTERTSAGSRAWAAIASSADGTRLIAAATNDGVYISTNGGASWSAVSTGVVGTPNWAGVASSADGTRLAAVNSGGSGDGSIYISTNSGASWTRHQVDNPQVVNFQNPVWRSIASSADGMKLVAGTTGDYLWTSADGGSSWTQRTGAGSYTSSWYAVAYSDNGSTIVAAEHGGYIWTSTNGGASWVQRTGAGSHSWLSAASSADGTHLVAVGQSNYINVSDDGGATWAAQSAPGSHSWNGVAMNDTGSLIVSGVYNGDLWTGTD